MSDRLMLDVLAKTAEDWDRNTQSALTVVIGLFMRQMEVTSVDLSIDPADVNDVINNYDLDRQFYIADDGKRRMKVSMSRKDGQSISRFSPEAQAMIDDPIFQEHYLLILKAVHALRKYFPLLNISPATIAIPGGELKFL